MSCHCVSISCHREEFKRLPFLRHRFLLCLSLLLLQGAAGQKMREEIIAKIEKWQEPPPAKTVKPLPKPDEKEVS